MQSGKSWFNGTLFCKNMTRFWPIWGLYLVIWLFAFPVNVILANYDPRWFASEGVLQVISPVGLPLAVMFSILAAMAVWSYLYNGRFTGMMHTLPIRREGLFLTNYLSGLAFFVGPNVVIFVLTLLAEAARNTGRMGPLCMWLACMTLMELFFFSFATFCAMFTGHILCLPAFYGILNVLAAGLVWLLDRTMAGFVFGYTGITGLWRAVAWLTPVWKLEDSLWISVTNDGRPWLVGLGYILIYAFFGVVFAALALVVYRRREMERAGDVVTVPWVRPVFQYGVAFCSALAFGTLLYTIFYYALPQGAWTLLFFMLLCGAAGCFIARMLLEKTFRVFHAWKGCAIFLGVLVVLTCAMEFDLTGFERRVPDASQVAEVWLHGNGSVPYDSGRGVNLITSDPEAIQAVVDLHRATIQAKGEIEGYEYGEYWRESTNGISVQIEGTTGFEVSYTLTNGRVLTREYSYCIPVNSALLSDPDSPAARLEALINMPQAVQAAYGLTGVEPEQLVDMRLSYYTTEEGYQYAQIDRADIETIYEAVLADLAEGNLGRRYLLEDEERMENCYVNNLEIDFYRPDANSDSYTSTAPDHSASRSVKLMDIGLQTTAVHTLAALERLGILKGDVQLITHFQMEKANAQWEENGGSWDGIELAPESAAVIPAG